MCSSRHVNVSWISGSSRASRQAGPELSRCPLGSTPVLQEAANWRNSAQPAGHRRQFRQLVKEIAKSRHVRIGIDKLDKIESPEAAWQFMNEIKVLFLIPDCVFLISVSEDAMSTFQRRGLPFRDVFDSSFDDVVPVGYLDASGAIALVERRIVGLRVPFILLCHCMAGGLARDVIRAARDVVTLNSERSADLTLSGVTRLLVTDDINQKAEAALVACRRVSAARGVDALLTWLHTATRTDWSADMLLSGFKRHRVNCDLCFWPRH